MNEAWDDMDLVELIEHELLFSFFYGSYEAS